MRTRKHTINDWDMIRSLDFDNLYDRDRLYIVADIYKLCNLEELQTLLQQIKEKKNVK